MSWSFLHLVSRSCVIEISSTEQNKAHTCSQLVSCPCFWVIFFVWQTASLLILFFSWYIMEKHTEDMKIGQQFCLFDQFYGWNKSCAWREKFSKFLASCEQVLCIEIFSSEQTKAHIYSQPVSCAWYLVIFFVPWTACFSPSAKVCWIHVFYLPVWRVVCYGWSNGKQEQFVLVVQGPTKGMQKYNHDLGYILYWKNLVTSRLKDSNQCWMRWKRKKARIVSSLTDWKIIIQITQYNLSSFMTF